MPIAKEKKNDFELTELSLTDTLCMWLADESALNDGHCKNTNFFYFK